MDLTDVVLSGAKDLGRWGARTGTGDPSPRFFLAEPVLRKAEGLVRMTLHQNYVEKAPVPSHRPPEGIGRNPRPLPERVATLSGLFGLAHHMTCDQRPASWPLGSLA